MPFLYASFPSAIHSAAVCADRFAMRSTATAAARAVRSERSISAVNNSAARITSHADASDSPSPFHAGTARQDMEARWRRSIPKAIQTNSFTRLTIPVASIGAVATWLIKALHSATAASGRPPGSQDENFARSQSARNPSTDARQPALRKSASVRICRSSAVVHREAFKRTRDSRYWTKMLCSSA